MNEMDYNKIPWYRKSGWNSFFLLIAFAQGLVLILTIATGQTIIFWLFGLPIWITIISLVTGDIYMKKKDEDGFLKKWSVANKVVAVIVGVWTIYSFFI